PTLPTRRSSDLRPRCPTSCPGDRDADRGAAPLPPHADEDELRALSVTSTHRAPSPHAGDKKFVLTRAGASRSRRVPLGRRAPGRRGPALVQRAGEPAVEAGGALVEPGEAHLGAVLGVFGLQG